MSRLTERSRKFLIPSVVAVGLAVTLAASMMTTVLPSPMVAFAQTTQGSPAAATTAGQATDQKPGSINLVQGAKEFLNDNLNATLIDAMTAAETGVPNSTAIAGHLSVVQSSLVYNVTVADADNGVAYNVFVDPANGKVLSKTGALQLAKLGLPTGFENATTTLADAAGVAEDQVQNGITIDGSIEGAHSTGGAAGALVYNITAVDIANGTLHKIKIDSATGKPLSSPEVESLGQLHIGNIF